MKSGFKIWLQCKWYEKNLSPLLWPLIPFAWIFHTLSLLRRIAYQRGLLKQYSFQIPIIIVGNLTVGGTGKTPLVVHIAKMLKQHGFHPGVVSKGYRGTRVTQKPVYVDTHSDPKEVGDEPVLLAKHLDCPIVVSTHRSSAIQSLLNSHPIDVIISDDGLQHYALSRDIEIVVIDGKRRFGNGWVLPVGPLRELPDRLKNTHFTVVNEPQTFDNDSEFEMELRPYTVYNGILNNHLPITHFQNQVVHAVAGIGHPERFFELLEKQGISIIPHVFPDHHSFQEKDLQFNDNHPILMTEKDAVKCTRFMKEHYWVLAVNAIVNPLFDVKLLTRLQELKHG